MTNKVHLKKYRERVNIPLHDVAHLLNMDISSLAKVEKGLREPNTAIIMLYHILFDVPLLDLTSDQYDEFKILLKQRSRSLVEKLHITEPPKSKNRIQFIEKFVNNVIPENYER